MFGTLGVPEIAIIFILALVLFGPKKLPELGRTIGKAMTEFRRASNDLKATFDREMQTLERENQSLQASTRETAKEIYDHAVPPESIWNPQQQSLEQGLDEHETATQSSTVGASEVLGAESNETVPAEGAAETAAAEPAAVAPGLEGTVPRSGTTNS